MRMKTIRFKRDGRDFYRRQNPTITITVELSLSRIFAQKHIFIFEGYQQDRGKFIIFSCSSPETTSPGAIRNELTFVGKLWRHNILD